MIATTKTKSLSSFPKSSEINKLILIRMARKKSKRPDKNSVLGRAFYNYTIKSSKIYDESFTKKLKELNPEWFLTKTDKAKRSLVIIAKNNKNKPHYKTRLGGLLKNYTYYHESGYDPKFTKLIKKLRPDWFTRSSDIRKQELIEIAKSGKKRPNQKTTKLGKSLTSYTIVSSQCYDSVFTEKIRKLRPDWFSK